MKFNSVTTRLCLTVVGLGFAEAKPPTPVGNYRPPIPSSYAGCAYDPNNAKESIAFFNGNNGLPIVNLHGRAALSSDPSISSIPSYRFASVADAPPGVFDLISNVDNTYVAVFPDGHVGFTHKSSKGQSGAVGDAAEKGFVTTIWSVDCNGALLAGIAGGQQFEFGTASEDNEKGCILLFAQPSSSSLQKRGIFSLVGKAVFRLVKKITVRSIPIDILLTLLHARTDLGIDKTRCTSPLTPIVKWDAPAPSSNGCGSPPFVLNYKSFADARCCVDHDLCFDNCDETLFGCNKPFADCTFHSCDTSFPGSDLGSLTDHLGCEIMASTFTYIVESEIGRTLFNQATDARCACCKPGEVSCPSGCADLDTDAQNCGKCGNACPAGQKCAGGKCANSGCSTPRTCGSFVPGECGGSDLCYCWTSASAGAGVCGADAFCSGLADCNGDSDCGEGGFCAVGTCCGRNVCMLANCPNPARKLIRMARRGTWVEATTAQPAHWE